MLVRLAAATIVAAAFTAPTAAQPSAPGRLGAPVIAAAGDIACYPGDPTNNCRDAATAALLAGADRVLTLGDNQYQQGTLTEFRNSYDQTWGPYKTITKPVPGNHEYLSGGNGYYAYFGKPEWYSFDVGAWHLVSLKLADSPEVVIRDTGGAIDVD